MKLKLFSILLLLAVLYSCSEQLGPPVYDNPCDPKSPYYISPMAEVVHGVENNGTINSTSVNIQWEGQSINSEFTYKLEGIDKEFSSWSLNTDVTYEYLNEGEYVFYVKERVNNIEQEEATSVTFLVDAVTSCGLVLNKMYTNVDYNSTFYVDLNIEEVANFKGLNTTLSFVNTDIELTNVSIMSGDLYTNSEVFIATTIEDANSTGEIEISLVILGVADGFTGSAPVCRLNFNAISVDPTEINFIENKTTFRDIENTNIPVSTLRKAVIDIN